MYAYFLTIHTKEQSVWCTAFFAKVVHNLPIAEFVEVLTSIRDGGWKKVKALVRLPPILVPQNG